MDFFNAVDPLTMALLILLAIALGTLFSMTSDWFDK